MSEQCYYHAVWATRRREPLLTREIEPYVFMGIRMETMRLKGSILAVNAALNHIHILVSLPLDVTVAAWVRSMKRSSSYYANSSQPYNQTFHWQVSYNILAVGEDKLPAIINYIERQKEHHANKTLSSVLEYMGE